MPVVIKKTCDQTIVEVYTCPAPEGGIGVPYIGVNVGGGVGVYKLTDQQVAPREHHFYTLVGINGTQVNLVGDTIEIEGGNNIEFASLPETDAGVIDNKAIHPLGGAYAYDRFRYPGQHAAGKGTEVTAVTPSAGVVTIDCNDSNVFEITFDQNLQFANPVNPIKGQTINVFLKQDATGNRTVPLWGSAWTFFNGEPILSTAPNAVDMLSCQYDDNAGKWRCSFLTGFTTGVVGSGVPYTLANVGTGAEVYKQTIDELGTDVAQLRSLTEGYGISITQNADDVSIGVTQRIFVQATTPTNPQVGDLWFW